MSARSLRDATKALQNLFSSSNVPSSLPHEARRALQYIVDGSDRQVNESDASAANQQLRALFDKVVQHTPSKYGAFAGVLRELRPIILVKKDVLEWWQLVLKPVLISNPHKKAAQDDVYDFLVGALCYDEDEDDAIERSSLSSQIARELLNLFVARSESLTGEEQDGHAAENQIVANRIENILIAFGKKKPKDFCYGVDDLIQSSATRIPALSLLGSFLKHQIPHLYLVISSPLIETLLKCLMNDTSTTVLSVALNTLIMILPHVPGALGPHLPRLFLVYSRLLCWEKFSPLSTEAQRSMVTDDRIATGSDGENDAGDVGIDPNWEKARPQPGLVEASTPEIKNYFTFLYGLYPLNFMSYIRRPRRFLKSFNFPGADDFDLDQAVIRIRSDQFREMHRLHPNFYNLALEEELEDPKWIRTDPADVVAECQNLVINTISPILSPARSPGPPPAKKLPDIPPLPPFSSSTPATSGTSSPAGSHGALRNSNGWREIAPRTYGQASAADALTTPLTSANSSEDLFAHRKAEPGSDDFSSTLDEFPLPITPTSNRPKRSEVAQTNLGHLQRQITLLTNELNFEKWHKAQYSQHISQLARKNVKDATVEAETLNLINANRALKRQIDQIRDAREKTLKDNAITRKQTNDAESHMTERFRSMRKEQESWMADSAELRRLRDEISRYRELLVASEARELSKTHELELLRRDLEQLQSLQDQLKDANKRVREYEYREFDFERSRREVELLQREKDTLQMKMQRRDQESDRSQRAFKEKIADLEARIDGSDSWGVRSPPLSSPDPNRMNSAYPDGETQAKLSQLKKAYARLLEKHTDLELECQSLKSQLEMYQGHSDMSSLHKRSSGEGNFDFGVRSSQANSETIPGLAAGDSFYDSYNSYPTRLNAAALQRADALNPITRRYPPDVASRADSATTRSSTQLVMYNQTAPLEEVASSLKGAFSDTSTDTSSKDKRKAKIQPTSEVRVYGRGGAQNIKLKTKDKKPEPEKHRSAFKGLKSIISND